jgi:hypothetical protein
MANFLEVLLKSCDNYNILHSKIEAAVRFAETGNFNAVASTVEEFKSIFTEIKDIDRQLYALSNASLIKENIDLWNSRVQLIETNSAFHKKTLPHLLSIMALQQAELKKIKSGIRGMSGYQTGQKYAGALIKQSS